MAQMVRTINDIEDDDTPDSSSPRESRRADQKGNNALRSKHSETEQRRRSKINERFQILRDLIPENDQKRDKASFLLEVIQYIQFLHEKLQFYEGSCHSWSPEPTKLTPWKINSGPIESFVNQSPLERLLSGNEDTMVLNQTSLGNIQNSVELDLTGAALYKPTDNMPMATSQGLHANIPLQPPFFEGVSGLSHQGSFPNADQLTQQSQTPFGQGTTYVDDCSVPLYSENEEHMKSENGEACISSAYSQGLLNSLTNALRSSRVDLSQANISVKLDVRKQTDGKSTETTDMKDHENPSGFSSVAHTDISEDYAHPHKRFRADES